MRPLVPFFACLMIVLTLWSGSAAHASEQVGPVAVEAAAHFEGDRDQVPADEHQPVPHHHAACHADNVSLPAELPPVRSEPVNKALVAMRASQGLPEAPPGATLRPPIA